ncbi:hypothetical protein C8R48DRAFT_770393 [Suillus tomentosus]|nr:hypothetical protein C8R48DRAFT_770393 [Suillus tomentosus]
MVRAVFLSSRRRIIGHTYTRKKGPKLSREARQALTARQREKRADEDAAVDDILTYIDEQATVLARRFGRNRRHYLEKFYVGSVLWRKRHNKTSAWSAFLHFKSEKFNSANLRAIAKETKEYHELTVQQHTKMVEEFEKIKTSGMSKPVNITARTRLAEVNSSFAAMVSEAEALKEHVGTESLIVTVRSSPNLNMLPKVHLTSNVVSQFVRTLLWEDPMKLGIKMESTVLAGLAPRNVLSMSYTDRKLAAKQGIRSGLNEIKVTENPNTTLEFIRYERMVQEHLAKLVGWCHNEWGNPSNLKGGVDALEALARAVSDEKCKFVRITRQEADGRIKHIEAGEILTPNKVDQEPEESPVIPVDNDNDDIYNDNDTSTNQIDHLPTSTLSSSPTLPEHAMPLTPAQNVASGPAPRTTSEITNDLIDPALQASPSIPNVSIPSPPLATETSSSHGSHTESLLPNTQPPNGNPFLLTPSASNSTPLQSNVLAISTNHKQGAQHVADGLGVLSKRRRKLTEKAALYVASRKSKKSKKSKRDRKSAAVVESDEENGWEDVDNASTY